MIQNCYDFPPIQSNDYSKHIISENVFSNEIQFNFFSHYRFSHKGTKLERNSVLPTTAAKLTFLFNIPQCRIFCIFLSFRFNVKWMLENLKVLKLPILPILGLWILLIWSISTFKKCKIHNKLKFRAFECGRFCTTKILRIDFT